MKVNEQTVRTARVELTGGQEVRLVRWSDDAGGHLHLSVSWPETPLGGRGEDSLRLPGGALPELVMALEKLENAP